jgi:hypothetical protein
MSDRRAFLAIRSLRFAVAHSACGIPSNSRSDVLMAYVFFNARARRRDLADRFGTFALIAICHTSRFNY